MTDFGTDGFYAGVMKAVLLAHAPQLVVSDLGHGVAPGAIREAGYLLEAAWDHLPRSAVLVVVVDPGVGSSRRILRGKLGERSVVAPDNGLLTGWLERPGAELGVLDPASFGITQAAPTFHGRDIFAPIAARLAGRDEAPAWNPCSDPVLLDGWRGSSASDGRRRVGEIIAIDRFGNLITNLRSADLGDLEGWRVGLPDGAVPLARTFSDVDAGHPLAYSGSGGHLEIAVRDGSAATVFGLGVGAPVIARRGG